MFVVPGFLDMADTVIMFINLELNFNQAIKKAIHLDSFVIL
ncbi:hypothetical protein [Virgibacillus oceani]|uniref:Uncharacterized protein n=1 Tax=Virgibacillus oceani TaxID=1479511 RepID=A0A917HJ02_9BACI|nr:hypothetical protein [Virgibacillus oceani]GGG79700.1 hypothetical protein GCM10011398_26290 [Virgibacillus oceani]